MDATASIQGLLCSYTAALEPFKDRHILDRGCDGNRPAALVDGAVGSELPLPGGEVYLPLKLVQMEDGGHQVAAEIGVKVDVVEDHCVSLRIKILDGFILA